MINVINNLSVVDFIGERKGTFQAVIKVPAGFMVTTDLGSELPSLNRWKKGALQTIQFLPEDSAVRLTVFAKKGTKVLLMDLQIAERLEVGTVNSLFSNTNLMDAAQYRAVHAKTWADKVFLLNKNNLEKVV